MTLTVDVMACERPGLKIFVEGRCNALNSTASNHNEVANVKSGNWECQRVRSERKVQTALRFDLEIESVLSKVLANPCRSFSYLLLCN